MLSIEMLIASDRSPTLIYDFLAWAGAVDDMERNYSWGAPESDGEITFRTVLYVLELDGFSDLVDCFATNPNLAGQVMSSEPTNDDVSFVQIRYLADGAMIWKLIAGGMREDEELESRRDGNLGARLLSELSKRFPLAAAQAYPYEGTELADSADEFARSVARARQLGHPTI